MCLKEKDRYNGTCIKQPTSTDRKLVGYTVTRSAAKSALLSNKKMSPGLSCLSQSHWNKLRKILNIRGIVFQPASENKEIYKMSSGHMQVCQPTGGLRYILILAPIIVGKDGWSQRQKTESRLGQGVKELKAREEKNKQGGGFWQKGSQLMLFPFLRWEEH